MARQCIKCGEKKSLDRFPVETTRHGSQYIRKQCRSCRAVKRTTAKNRELRKRRLKKKPLYEVWRNMRSRCDNADNNRYGGRGITYCDRWASYDLFAEDMLPTYKKGLQIDRIDNNGHYCPENCKWSTPTQQANNRGNSRYIEFRGKAQTLAAWARELGLKKSTLSQRFYSYKWPVEKVLTYNLTP